MNQLENCSVCEQLYVRTVRNICPSCHKKREDRFQAVYTFIRKKQNRQATMADISEAVDVEEKEIIQFIKEGRLELKSFPQLFYPCASCGEGIREGKICSSCHIRLKTDLEQETYEQERSERLREEHANIYRSKQAR